MSAGLPPRSVYRTTADPDRVDAFWALINGLAEPAQARLSALVLGSDPPQTPAELVAAIETLVVGAGVALGRSGYPDREAYVADLESLMSARRAVGDVFGDAVAASYERCDGLLTAL